MNSLWIAIIPFCFGFVAYAIKTTYLNLPKKKNHQESFSVETPKPVETPIAQLTAEPEQKSGVCGSASATCVPMKFYTSSQIITQKIKDESKFFFHPTIGKNILRILPALPNKSFFQTKRQHYFDNGRVYQCGKEFNGKEWGGSCPICEHYFRLSLFEQKEKTRQFRPVERFYYNVLIPDQGVKVISVSDSVHQEILNAIKKHGDITSPLFGRNVILFKSISLGGYPQYRVEIGSVTTAAPYNQSHLMDLEKLTSKWHKTYNELLEAVQFVAYNP